MAEATVASISESIQKNLAAYMVEIQQAGPHWERKPAAGGSGEDGWCAREVAEHIAGSAPFFGAGIAQAIGVPGPTPARVPLPTVGDAAALTTTNYDVLVKIVAQVPADRLNAEIDHPRLGKQTLAGILNIVSGHLLDHAGQLKQLRESNE